MTEHTWDTSKPLWQQFRSVTQEDLDLAAQVMENEKQRRATPFTRRMRKNNRATRRKDPQSQSARRAEYLRSEAVVGKLREAESLLLSLENANPSVDALHDAKICVWNAIDKIGTAMTRTI